MSNILTEAEVYEALCRNDPGVRNAVVEWIGGLCNSAPSAMEVECPRCSCKYLAEPEVSQ